jgi:hypothetical protein
MAVFFPRPACGERVVKSSAARLNRVRGRLPHGRSLWAKTAGEDCSADAVFSDMAACCKRSKRRCCGGRALTRIALVIRVIETSEARFLGSRRQQRGCYNFQDASDIAQHIVIPEPQHPIVAIDEPFFANRVARIVGMLSAVDFDDEATFAADQIYRVRTDRFLSDELVTVKPPRSESAPKSILGIGGQSPQTSSAHGPDFIGFAHVATPPRPVQSRGARFHHPLPASGAREETRHMR